MADGLRHAIRSPLLERDLEFEREVLACSGIFDEFSYVQSAGQEAQTDPIGHYLRRGWMLGIEPHPAFPGNLLRPYFANVGFSGPPSITWLVLRSAGWPIPGSREDLEQLASQVRVSEGFQEALYVSNANLAADLDPAIHYVAVGEQLGIRPSAEFDPAFYRECYPDLVEAGVIGLLHFVKHGRGEGRSGSPAKTYRRTSGIHDPAKENVLLVVHEASRTGAPILGWNIALHLARRYNIFTVHLGEGDLVKEFQALSAELHGPFLGSSRSPREINFRLSSLFQERKFRYAIVNSAESRNVLYTFLRHGIPTLLLMHEFMSYVRPRPTMLTALDWSTEVIFPARIVAQAAMKIREDLQARAVHILPQGVSALPLSDASSDEEPDSSLQQLIRKHDQDGAFLVLGAGAVQIRKGVDLFLAAAAAAIRSNPGRQICFLWVGQGFRPEEDMIYSVYLQEQLSRSGLTSHVTFLDEVTDLEPIYRIADAFLLSSRLDPLPNVFIDAAIRGIPVICFRDASGAAELLLSDPELAGCVAEHLDAESAGRLLIELAQDGELRKRVGAATQRLARRTFNMEHYVGKLDEIGTAARARVAQRLIDAKTLLDDLTFDEDMYQGPYSAYDSREDAITQYLAIAGSRGWHDEESVKGIRRPSPGFNPRVYAIANRQWLTGGVDPLADFVRRHKPAGPWQAPVFRADDPANQTAPARLRVALHAHFYYPDLAGEFLSNLRRNRMRCDLLISTDEEVKARQLDQALAEYANGSVRIQVVPNRGRDIGPLLTAFAGELSDYDVVGHVHAKRSLFNKDLKMGETWRKFLWQNLLGGPYPMLDRIMEEFERREELGLVFPSDPNLFGWDTNRPLASEIAARIGYLGDLPAALDFPLGTMFWMRRDALRPLLNLRFDWNDYPAEPVDDDGSLLHALERVIPISAEVAGFTWAVTHVPGVSR